MPETTAPQQQANPMPDAPVPRLQDLLAAAQPGDTISVQPGCHPGPFRITTPDVRVLGTAGAVLLGPIVLVAGTLEGCTLKPEPVSRAKTSQGFRPQNGRPTTAALEPPLVEMAMEGGGGGPPALIDCDVGGLVRVGRGGAARVERNRIHVATGAGVELVGTVEGCTVCQNTIEASGGAGIAIRRRSRAHVEANRVLRAGGAGIEVAAQAAATLHDNHVHDGRGPGVLVHGGATAELRGNDVRRNFSSSVEVSGEASAATLVRNTLADGQSGVGLLVHRGAGATATENVIRGHPIANVEVGAGSAPTVERNTLEGSGGVGLLLAAGAAGVYRANVVRRNARAGIECCSKEMEHLLLEANQISQQRGGVGALLHSGGAGRWHDNAVFGNRVGIELRDGARPALLRTDVRENRHTGLHIGPGAAGEVRDCHIHRNGNGRLVAGGRRGARTHGDEAGAGVLLKAASDTALVANRIGGNAGAGVFADNLSRSQLQRNVLADNRGPAISSRPSSRAELLGNIDADRQAVNATVVRRQRVPFDQHLAAGANVTPQDKSLHERVDEMAKSYRAMSGSGDPAGVLALVPDGAGASEACTVM